MAGLTYAETVGDSTPVYVGDQLLLTFVDEDQGWLDFWDAEPDEFAREVIKGLQGQSIPLGLSGVAIVLVEDGWGEQLEDGSVAAHITARVQDLRPPEQRREELQAGVGDTLKVAILIAVLAAGLFALHPVLVEVRRTVRGFTTEENESAGASATTSYVGIALLSAGALALVYLYFKRKR